MQGKPQVGCTVVGPGQRAGWNLLRASESREQGRDGGDTALVNVGDPMNRTLTPSVPTEIIVTLYSTRP